MKPQTHKPQLLKGTRDWDDQRLYNRQQIIDTIRTIYSRYGFSPLETPALERLDTLLGHYGHEGDQLIFKILNSGNFLADVPLAAANDYKKLQPYLTEKGLRYDLTLPLMRYVATNYQHLPSPYKRYQIQPVWRADRPQQGRYREFYQCDADTINSPSLLCEAELLTMAHEVLCELGITNHTILINHRTLLNAIARLAGAEDRTTEFCIALDKLDKLGQKRVIDILIQQGYKPEELARIEFIFEQRDPETWLATLRNRLQHSEEGLKGVYELETLLAKAQLLQSVRPIPLQLDPTLARGLAYYTGTVFEIKIPSIQSYSIGGGGRYDNFANQFGINGLTGVGLSFGLDRLYEALQTLNLLTKTSYQITQVLFTNLDPIAENQALPIVVACRKQGITTEIYPDPVPLKKQLTYAHKKAIPWVVMTGPPERETNQWIVKNMQTGIQTTCPPQTLVDYLVTII